MLEEISHLMLGRNFVYPTYGKHFCILRNGEFFFTSYIMENIFTSYVMKIFVLHLMLWRTFLHLTLWRKINYVMEKFYREKFKDTKWVIRSCKSQNDRQSNG